MKFYESFLFYVAIALLLIAPFSGYAVVALLFVACLILLADFLLRSIMKSGWRLRVAQILVLPFLAILLVLPRTDRAVYLKVVLPPGFVGEVSIYLGIKGTPPLASDTATIVIPSDGLFLTSTVLNKDEPLGTNLNQQGLPFCVLKAPASFDYCTGYSSIDYLVSNVDSIRTVLDTFSRSRPRLFHDSLMNVCMDKL
jgi:hypothetical protein